MKKPTKSKRAKLFELFAARHGWGYQAQHTYIAERPGAMLTIIAQDGGSLGWIVAAVEVPTANLAGSLGDVFDDHSHADLGKFKTLVAAQRAAEKYAAAWKRRRARKKACACKPIKSARKGRAA